MAVAVVSVQRVTKRYAGHTAVHALSLEVPSGGIFGLLGPNGAGKTTTIRMLLSIITPDEGQVVLFGGGGSGRELAPRIGYLPAADNLDLCPFLNPLFFFSSDGRLCRVKRENNGGCHGYFF